MPGTTIDLIFEKVPTDKTVRHEKNGNKKSQQLPVMGRKLALFVIACNHMLL
jgi:hypothetical protein